MYSEEILTIWQDDKSPENPLIDPMGRKLFKQFLTGHEYFFVSAS